MITAIIAIFCLILGAGLVYLFMQLKVKVTQEEDKEILEKNKAVQFELQAMEQRTDYLKEQYEQKLQEFRRTMPRLESERLTVMVALSLAQEVLSLNKGLQEQTHCQRLIKQMINDTEKTLSEAD